MNFRHKNSLRRLFVLFSLILIFVDAAFSQQNYSFDQVNEMATSGSHPEMVGIRALYEWYGYGTPQSLEAVESGITADSAQHPFCIYNLALIIANRAKMAETPMESNALSLQANNLAALAIPVLQRLSEEGDPYAELMLGECYEKGRGGLPVDRAMAKTLYIKASKANIPLAWTNLALLLLKDGSNSKNTSVGIELIKKSSEVGVPIAEWVIAEFNLNGLGGYPKSIDQGIAFLKEGADNHNFSLSQFELGRIYYESLYGLNDRDYGVQMIRKAAENCWPDAVVYARKNGISFTPVQMAPPQVAVDLIRESKPAQSQSVPVQVADTSTLDPAAIAFRDRFSQKCEEVSGTLSKAISQEIGSNSPSASGALLILDPAGGKASDWMENALAAPLLEAKNSSSFASAISYDREFIFSSLDMLQILPLVAQSRYSAALQKIVSYLNPSTAVSTPTLQGVRKSFDPLAQQLNQIVMKSDELRKKAAADVSDKKYDMAEDALKEASKIDLRDQDTADLAAIQKEQKKNAFGSELGL